MWGPAAGLPPRRVQSALAGAGRFCLWRPGAATRRPGAAWGLRGFSDSYLQPLPYLDFEESFPGESRLGPEPKRYITHRGLARTLGQLLLGRTRRDAVILECNPGPGILTQVLLEFGSRVVALESERAFIPHLESLGKDTNGKLDVVHCDFFKLDPKVCEVIKPPIMISKTLFKSLGIKALPWSEGIPLKVFGIFPIKHERKALWKLLYHLYACNSIYRYGRVELNMFIGEREYQRLTATPKSPDTYQVLSVIGQVACEVKLLHKEPWSSFDVYAQSGKLEKPKNKEISELMEQNMYFIRLIPRKNLFTENLTPINFDIFFHMVRHCFGKPNASLLHHLRALSPIDSKEILRKMKISETKKVNKMSPRDFKQVFERIESMEGDGPYKWLYDDSMDDSLV
ncbi:dimethyladenosine transferase 2, mitochondrial [Dipodomys spectabilis]|uniref:dimethyladenosine transferase 2, mitochondrial n=1 Tax=Dipodomys spectabilis TaxID=105255 RepID=UPI001C544BFC|nr:dimethyladenosine transferase 2, mitochondrial [Dipodomys spectabilis]